MLVSVHVIPRSARNKLEWVTDTLPERGEPALQLKARLMAPPVDNAANEALVKLLASQFALPKRAVTIVRGATSRQKVVDLAGLTAEDLKQRLPAF